MQESIRQLGAAGIQVVAISYDPADVLKEFARKRKITFPLLSDRKSEVIRAFGVLNDRAGGRQAGIAHPGTFVIGPDGTVHTILSGTVRKRHSARDLLEAVARYDRDDAKPQSEP